MSGGHVQVFKELIFYSSMCRKGLGKGILLKIPLCWEMEMLKWNTLTGVKSTKCIRFRKNVRPQCNATFTATTQSRIIVANWLKKKWSVKCVFDFDFLFTLSHFPDIFLNLTISMTLMEHWVTYRLMFEMATEKIGLENWQWVANVQRGLSFSWGGGFDQDEMLHMDREQKMQNPYPGVKPAFEKYSWKCVERSRVPHMLHAYGT